jgi:protein-L-isoaspartate(D-aspartate) O-methyltransferase
MRRHRQRWLVELIKREGLRDPRIVEAFRTVPREDFVPREFKGDAYVDRPVPIPRNQVTSQPTLIARMVDAAAPGPEDGVLEVGAGYGSQTALLARLAKEVVSIERYPDLAEAARGNLVRAGITNAEVVVGDGSQGWPQRAPYKVIVVSAAAQEVPAPLADQLADGGRLVIPLSRAGSDDVYVFEKHAKNLQRIQLVSPAHFVPLVPGPPNR